jgi:hypothetical protein
MHDEVIEIEDIDIEFEAELPAARAERNTLIPDYDVERFARAISFEEDDTPTRAIPRESLSALVRSSVPPEDEVSPRG